MRLLLIAAPGAGKGTQAKRLSAHSGIEHISTGDLLRREVAARTPVGQAVKEYLERGDLVPDDVMMELIRERIIAATAAGGYILDGFPRNLRQAEHARGVALELGVAVQAAIYLQIDRDQAIQRLLNRARREGRSDDDEAVIHHRMDVFERETLPLVAFYDELGILVQVNAEPPPDQVTEEILERLAALSKE